MTDETNIIKKEHEPCVECQMEELFVAIGAAHTICPTLQDPEKKEKCVEWAQSLDPENVESATEIYKKALELSGVKGLRRVSSTFNAGVRNAIIESVGERLKQGKPVPDEEVALYKRYTMKEGI